MWELLLLLHFHCKSHNGNNKEIACERPQARQHAGHERKKEAKTDEGKGERKGGGVGERNMALCRAQAAVVDYL